MARSVKATPAGKRLTIDFEAPDWQGLKDEAARKAHEGGTPVKPTHIVRLAVKRYLQQAEQGTAA